MRSIHRNRQGFSIIELMVVIAIIGILATIAVPNFQKFQAKAKQSNAKVELTGIYTAEQAFFTEFGQYHSNLPFIGYVPDGIPQDAAGCPSAPAATTGVQRTYAVGFGAATVAANTAVAGRTPACAGAGPAAYLTNYPHVNIAQAPDALGGDVFTTTTFTAQARGKIRGGAPNDDVWTIDQLKGLLNTTQGY